MPDLPIPAENLGATVIGHTLYVFGGQVDTVGRTASNRTFGIDLDNVRRGWKELAPMPGPGRILPVVTTVGNSAFVFSGAALVKGARGAIARRYLVDGYRYEPGSRWIRIADLPRPALAAPSPAPFARNFVYVLGGDDGTHIALRPSAHHPGFNRSVLRYDPKANRWDRAGGYLPGVVTAPVAPWRGGWAIISGEIVPGVRSNRVWLFRPPG
jgi:N-acetylneuraminic acid mutarotase